MDLVQSEKLVINELLEIYSDENFQNQLEGIASHIEIIFKTLLDEEGEDFQLVSKNSIRDLKFFSVIHRIKEPDSMKEKFYRSNLLQEKFQDFKFKNRSQVRSKRNAIKIRFKKCEDVIGIKILTDLNEDCKKVLSLLRNSETRLNGETILLNKKDLKSQPTTMKNGLEIYKVNGTYGTDYSFELQIKSKIVSAWGDMEHSIFYKDYYVSPVRESTQATMNHIGKLLFQIDDFLLSVRNANQTYELNSEVASFLSWFDTTYSSVISQKIGNVVYKIDGFSDALFFIKSKKHIPDSIGRRELQFDHFRYKATLNRNRNYTMMRNQYYDLKIFESIIFSWLWLKSSVKKSNIDAKLNLYLEVIIEFITESFLKEFEGFEKREIRRRVNEYLDELLQYKPKPKILLSPKVYIEHYRFMNFLRSEIELLYPTSSNQYHSHINFLDFVYLNIKVGGNYKMQIGASILENSNTEKMKEILNHIATKIKMKDKTEFAKEAGYTNDIINCLNEN